MGWRPHCVSDTLGCLSYSQGISHGERKRLSFATELLPDPYIIITDEPTTGLDALLAANVCQTLRNMADSGRIVVSTIHQPSSKAFSYFSHVLLLALGRTVYYGPTDTLITYFNRYVKVGLAAWAGLDMQHA